MFIWNNSKSVNIKSVWYIILSPQSLSQHSNVGLYCVYCVYKVFPVNKFFKLNHVSEILSITNTDFQSNKIEVKTIDKMNNVRRKALKTIKSQICSYICPCFVLAWLTYCILYLFGIPGIGSSVTAVIKTKIRSFR